MDNQKDIEFILGVIGGEPSESIAATMNALAAAEDLPELGAVSFSPFIPEDLDRAEEMFRALTDHADELRAAGNEHDQVVQSVIVLATKNAMTSGNPDMVRFALQLFLTHDSSGRTVRIPSLLRRMNLATPPDLAAGIEGAPSVGGSTTSTDEDKVNWFREDPLANEHHEHWHLVYRSRPQFSPLKERHGELFFYMHQQMLARYDAERMAAGIGRVVPFSNYTDDITVGYDAGDLIISGQQYKPRPANVAWQNMRDFSVADSIINRNIISQDIGSGTLTNAQGQAVPLSGREGSDIIGDAVEPTIKNINAQRYGWHHGMGHVFTAQINSQGPQDFGVMYHTSTAIRDPFFWRWHKNVDTFNEDYQNSQPSHDFSDAPEGISFDGSTPLAQDSITILNETSETDRLFTELREGVFRFTNGSAYNYNHIWHEPFSYQFSLKNSSVTTSKVTLRLFICPRTDGLPLEADPQLNDRSLWIEMDKFVIELNAQSQESFSRADVDSSVIRRPAINPADVTDISPTAGAPDDFLCECGWPYHMLLPGGKDSGMNFALFVIATDWEEDQVDEPGTCGSMSFCGAVDRYPDKRPMGYPFDRPLEGSLVEIATQNPNMALREITIQKRRSTEVIQP
ncbi:hypothetical protein N9W89_12110 [Hellea sp.]|nr:hypothetical protein [Hellea sp.]